MFPAGMREVAVALVALMAASCGFYGCMSGAGSEGRAAGGGGGEAGVPVRDVTEEARRWADSVASGMDTLRLAAQLFMPAVYASDDYWTMRQVREYGELGVGGIVLLKGDSRGAGRLAELLDSASEVLPFVSIDAEWGLRMRLADAPEFPANGSLGRKVEDQLMYDYGREVARECRLLGINMVLGPVLDVSDGGGFLGLRSFGPDASRVAELGIAYGRGLEDGNVIGVAKHFPGHGSAAADSHKRKGVIEGSLSRLDSVDLHPFREWIAAGMSGVMVGHLAVPAIDSRMYPAAVSATVIGDLLRDDLGFRGLVLTDAMNMLGAEGYGSDMAVKAGADIVVAPADTRMEIGRVARAVRNGVIGLDELRERARLILFYKYLIGLGGADGPDEGADTLRGLRADSIARRLAE